ncbi:tail fiber assembly protein [Salmonella enterica subsp. enterica serovar Mbandaka]|nr:tail fiber assembly protein [Salmonella enterica subsp. enterica serovar Mbandaka]
MKPVFDDNGLAIEAGDIRCFYYDAETMEYTGWSDEYIHVGVSMPGASTVIEPGQDISGKVAVFNGTGWEHMEDHRGETVFSTEDGTTRTVDYIGTIKNGFTTIPPSTQYDKWDGKKWITDADERHTASVAIAVQERQRLLAHADKVMLDWRTELMMGEISDANRAKLSAWLAYKNDVKLVDVTTDPEHVSWPVPPEA